MNDDVGADRYTHTTVILDSKITAPVRQENLQHRSRLMALIEEIESTSLILIQAPAGYGKTTLIKQYHQELISRNIPVAWLSVYHTENDPIRLITHIVAAFAILDPNISKKMARYFSATPAYQIEDIIAAFIVSLESFSGGVVLIIDDYHEIRQSEAHKAVFFLLSNLPSNVSCIVASRTRPPFAFHRLEEKGKVQILERKDLMFTEDETECFMLDTCGLELNKQTLEDFSKQTDGWITAIKLSAMSVDIQTDEHKLPKLLTGSQHALVDYLTEDIFNEHDKETQAFLLQTAPLGTLSVELCDAVTQQNNAALQLRKLAKENLFINSLDKEGKLFRYHSLFSEFLCGLLSQRKGDERSEIHVRASKWYRKNNMPVEAVEHARSSGDANYTLQVIDQSVQAMVRAGEISRLLSWLSQIPESIISSSPNLLSHLVWGQVLVQQIQGVEKTVALARELYLERSDTLGQEDQNKIPEYLLELEIVDIWLARISNERNVDLNALLSIKKSLQPSWTFLRALTESELGYYHLSQDKLESAFVAFQDAHVYAQAVPNALVVNLSTQMMAYIRKLQRRFIESEKLCLEGIVNAVDKHNKPLPVAGRFHFILADIYYETNALEQCREHLDKSKVLYSLNSDPELFTENEILTSKLLGLSGEPKAVVERLYTAERLVSKRGTISLVNKIRAYQVWYLLECNDLLAAEATLIQCNMPITKLRPAPDFHVNKEVELFYIVLCRYWIANEEYRKAGVWLRHLLKLADSSNRIHSSVIINGLLILMNASDNQHENTSRLMRGLLITASENNFARSIIDLGHQFTMLLDNYYLMRTDQKRDNIQDPVLDYLANLLSIIKGSDFVVPTSHIGTGSNLRSTIGSLEYESLTPRELQILELVAQGLKNREVADELLIAESSVRWHIKNFYTKLNVHNRTEASAKARELRLIR